MAILHDIDFYLNTDKKGNPIEHIEEDAIKNALLVWLTSAKGDIIENPQIGGLLDESVFKKMTPGKAQALEFKIKNAINNQFFPAVQLISVNVIPNYEDRLWEINIEYINYLNNQKQSLTIYSEDTTQTLTFNYEYIDKTGENLYNIVVLLKPSMGNRILRFDEEKGWLWGKYVFSNLTYDDPYFSAILELANMM